MRSLEGDCENHGRKRKIAGFMVGSTELHKVGHTVVILLVTPYMLPWRDGYKRKTDGAGCAGDKEIKLQVSFHVQVM